MVEGVEYLVKNISELRIFDVLEHLPMMPLIEHFDFTTIGLRTETPIYGEKGVKQSASYTLDGIEVVRKIFKYDSNGLWVTFWWFDRDGELGIEKIIFKPLNKVELAKIAKSNRDRSITYLQASGVGTAIEDFINDLLRHYKNEIDLFIYNNTDDFLNAVNNEANPLYLNYLGIPVEAPSYDYPTGKTVKDSILIQI